MELPPAPLATGGALFWRKRGILASERQIGLHRSPRTLFCGGLKDLFISYFQLTRFVEIWPTACSVASERSKFLLFLVFLLGSNQLGFVKGFAWKAQNMEIRQKSDFPDDFSPTPEVDSEFQSKLRKSPHRFKTQIGGTIHLWQDFEDFGGTVNSWFWGFKSAGIC